MSKRVAGINIEFENGYKLTSDSMCYCLEKIKVNDDVKSESYGKETYSLVGYFAMIENALERMFETEIRNCGAVTFEELVSEIKRAKSEIKSIAKNNLNITVIERENDNE
ncbi:MAG TPA: hypothetical protein GX707_16685 [Epulopiscium sp.]|nr:hypothetical protein [Candidatus Epulonipiscium sp.]